MGNPFDSYRMSCAFLMASRRTLLAPGLPRNTETPTAVTADGYSQARPSPSPSPRLPVRLANQS